MYVQFPWPIGSSVRMHFPLLSPVSVTRIHEFIEKSAYIEWRVTAVLRRLHYITCVCCVHSYYGYKS